MSRDPRPLFKQLEDRRNDPHPLSGADPIWSRITSSFEANFVVGLIIVFWLAVIALFVYASVK